MQEGCSDGYAYAMTDSPVKVTPTASTRAKARKAKMPESGRAPVISPKASGPRVALDRAAWIAKAREVLIAGGIGAVKVGKLAGMLAVTRESFYHHFKSLDELHDELLNDWDTGNVAAYQALLNSQRDGEREFRAMEKMWLEEGPYSPVWDAVVRDWARISKKAERVVRHVDERRVDLIRQMYLDMGYDPVEALVRARIYYFHQVGYYTIKPGESRRERMELFPVYIRVLLGRP